MTLLLTDEQLRLQDTVRRFFSESCDTAAVRAAADLPGGYDSALWRRVCSELGLSATHIESQYGGFGFGPVELGIGMEAMGRSLYPGPFFSAAVMGGFAVQNAASEPQKQQLLPEIAAGTSLTVLALDDWNASEAAGRQMRVVQGGDSCLISGTATAFVAADTADRFVLPARHDDGALSLFSVEAANDAVAQSALEVIDATRPAVQLTLTNAPATLLGSRGEAKLEELWDQLSVMLAYEMVGGAEALLHSTVEYMGLRVQFGRQISSFQALKHRCADLLVELELAKAATCNAGAVLAGEIAAEPYAANMAKAMAADAYMTIAKEAIQLRGGVGFTWEDDTHLWFKRAKSSEVLLGSPQYHREKMIQRLEGCDRV